MANTSDHIARKPPAQSQSVRQIQLPKNLAVAFLFGWALVACQSTAPPPPEAQTPNHLHSRLKAGDIIEIQFPAASEFTTTQKIRPDGQISLPFVGDVKVANKEPGDLSRELTQRYASELQVNEVLVNVQSSAFPVYVTGAVLSPGKIVTDQEMTALEAIMEAGGFDQARANVKRVVVIRDQNGERQQFVLNMKAALNGNSTDPFYLRPHDKVYVPESMF